MKWNEHLDLKDKHAFMSPSQPYWLTDTKEELLNRFYNSYQAAALGDAMHELAKELILNGIKLNQTDKHLVTYGLRSKGFHGQIDVEACLLTLLPYVNDAIGYRMTPEVPLKYSDYAFGTTDAIAFDPMTSFLRIHDLKTGASKPKIEQLLLYEAYFLLEYDIKPRDIQSELRIYQRGVVTTFNPTIEEATAIVDRVVVDNKILLKEKP